MLGLLDLFLITMRCSLGLELGGHLPEPPYYLGFSRIQTHQGSLLALVADWTAPLGAIGSTVFAKYAGTKAAREGLLGDLMALRHE